MHTNTSINAHPTHPYIQRGSTVLRSTVLQQSHTKWDIHIRITLKRNTLTTQTMCLSLWADLRFTFYVMFFFLFFNYLYYSFFGFCHHIEYWWIICGLFWLINLLNQHYYFNEQEDVLDDITAFFVPFIVCAVWKH